MMFFRLCPCVMANACCGLHHTALSGRFPLFCDISLTELVPAVLLKTAFSCARRPFSVVVENYAVALLCALRTGRKGLSAAFLCHGQFASRIIFVSLYKIVCGSAKPRLVKLCFPFLSLLSSFTIFAVCSCVFIGCGPYVGKHCVEMSLVMIRCAQT